VEVVRRGVVHHVDVGIRRQGLEAAVGLRHAERVGLPAGGRLVARGDATTSTSQAGGRRRCGGRRQSRPTRPMPMRFILSPPSEREPVQASACFANSKHFFTLAATSRCPGIRTRCRPGSATSLSSRAAAPRGSAVSPWPHGVLSPWFFLRSFRCRLVDVRVNAREYTRPDHSLPTRSGRRRGLTLKYFDIFIAAAKLSGVANSFGVGGYSEWPCSRRQSCVVGDGAIRLATVICVEWS